MAPFFVIDLISNPDDIYIERYAVPDVIEQSYSKGVPLPEAGPLKLYCANTAGRRVDFVDGIQFFPIVSDAFKDLLEAEQVSHVEFHAAQLVFAGEPPEGGYWLLNILDNVAALDRDRSRFRLFSGTDDVIVSIDELVLREEALQGRDIVRLAEMRSVILVSARLRASIEAAGLTGFAFQPTDKFKTDE